MPDNLEAVGLDFDTRDFERALNRAIRRLDQLEDAVDSSSRQARSAESQFISTGKAIGGMIAAYGGFRLIEETGHYVFQTNVEFQKLEARLVAITGSTTKAARAFGMITDFAKTTPFEVQNLVQAFTTLQAAGLEPTAEMLRGVGNFASSMGKDITDAVEAILRASQGGTERLRESFFIPISVQGEQLKINFRGTTTTVAKDAQSLIDHFAEIGNTDFAGGMAREMDTLGGALSNLSDSASIVAAAMGKDSGLNAELLESIRLLGEFIDSSEEGAVSLTRSFTRGLHIANEAIREQRKLMGDSRQSFDEVGGARAVGAFVREEQRIPGPARFSPVAPWPQITNPFGSDPFSAPGPRIQAGPPPAPAAPEFRDTATKLINQYEAEAIALEKNEAAALRFTLALQGLTEAEIEAVVASFERAESLKTAKEAAEDAAKAAEKAAKDAADEAERAAEKHANAIKTVTDQLELQRFELLGNSEGAFRYSLAVDGIIGKEQDLLVARWRSIDAMQMQKEVSEDLAAKALKELEAEQEQLKRSADRMAEAVVEAFTTMGDEAENLWKRISNAIDGILSELARLATRRLITEPLQNAFLSALNSGIGAAGGSGGDGGSGYSVGGSGDSRTLGGVASDFAAPDLGPADFKVSSRPAGGGPVLVVNMNQEISVNALDTQTATDVVRAQKGEILSMMAEGLRESDVLRRFAGSR